MTEEEKTTKPFPVEKVKIALINARSEDGDLRKAGLGEILILSKKTYFKAKLIESPGLVDALVDTFDKHGEPDAIYALTRLAASQQENTPQLLEWKTVVDLFVRAAQSGKTDAVKERGVKGLANLADKEENKLELLFWPGVMEVLLIAAQNGETNEAKRDGLRGLARLADKQENKARLVEWPGVIEAMVNAAQLGETEAIKENALSGLLLLADDSQASVIILNRKDVINVMLTAAHNQNAEVIRHLGFKGVVRLALMDVNLLDEKETRVQLLEWPGVIDTMLEGTKTGTSEVIRRGALSGLGVLASKHENGPRLIAWPGVVDAMKAAAEGTESDAIQQLGLFGLACLASCEAIKVRLFEWPGIMDVMLKAALDGSSEAVQERGLLGLANLAANDQNAVRVLEWNGVVEAMLAAAQNEQSDVLRQKGLTGLRYLGFKDENKIRLIKWPGVVDSMLHAAQHAQNDEVKETGLSGLCTLANNFTESTEMVFKYPGVTEVFTTLAQGDPSLSLTETALTGLWDLSDSRYNSEKLVSEWDILSWLKNVNQAFDSIVGIIYLNLAVSPGARDILARDDDTVESLENIVARNIKIDEKATFFAKLALAILRGSDPKYLALDETDLGTLLVVLNAALTREMVMTNVWPLLQPLVALRFLTTVDKNRDFLGTEWLIQLRLSIEKAMSDNDVYAVETALSSLAQYTLDERTMGIVKADPDNLKQMKFILLKKTSTPQWSGVVNAASGIVFTLEGNLKAPAQSTTFVSKGQVMISYAWGPPPHTNKDLASDIEIFLRESGFNVWRDEGAMKADIMQAMADAIASSEIILILINKSYMESANCKRELIFALNSKRKIVPLVVQHSYDHCTDGWLGLAIGSLLYYDISSPAKRNQELQRMLSKELNYDTTKRDMPKLRRLSSVRASSSKPPDSIDDIKAWAESCGLKNDVTAALIREGYISAEFLADLAMESGPDIKLLLNINQSAKATKLRKELLKLFPKQ